MRVGDTQSVLGAEGIEEIEREWYVDVRRRKKVEESRDSENRDSVDGGYGKGMLYRCHKKLLDALCEQLQGGG